VGSVANNRSTKEGEFLAISVTLSRPPWVMDEAPAPVFHDELLASASPGGPHYFALRYMVNRS
jgi:hypothetical protein